MSKFTKIELGTKQETCTKRSIEFRKRCCCNCAFHASVTGHPWVTGTDILVDTGLYVCVGLTGGIQGEIKAIASYKHGLCELWAPK